MQQRLAKRRLGRSHARELAVPAHGGVEVRVEDVHKSFGPIHALRGVSLTVAASGARDGHGPIRIGQEHAAQSDRQPRRARLRRITVAGTPVPGPREAVSFRRYVVGFVFQENLLLPYLSAEENIEAALIATHVPRHHRLR